MAKKKKTSGEGDLFEQANDGFQFALMGSGPGADDGIGPAAKRTGKTFLDHDVAFKAVSGQIRNPKATVVQKPGNRVLAVQQWRSRLQFIHGLLVSVVVGKFLKGHFAFQFHPDDERLSNVHF